MIPPARRLPTRGATGYIGSMHPQVGFLPLPLALGALALGLLLRLAR